MTNIKMEVDLVIAHIVWKSEFGNWKSEIGDMLLECWSNGPALVKNFKGPAPARFGNQRNSPFCQRPRPYLALPSVPKRNRIGDC